MSSRTPTAALLRMVLLTLLTLGLCMQPTFAATCSIDDARSELGNDAGTAVLTAAVDDCCSADDCCSNLLCSNCCLHAVGTFHCSGFAVASLMPMSHDLQRSAEFRPREYPVDIRPPIAR